MRMQTVRGTSIMRPTRSIAMPGVTSISSGDAPAQTHAVALPPSGVVAPMAVFQIGVLPPEVKFGVTLRTCTLLLESTMAAGATKGAFGIQPLMFSAPWLVQTMPVPSLTVPPAVAGHAGGALRVMPATPVLTWTFCVGSKTKADAAKAA